MTRDLSTSERERLRELVKAENRENLGESPTKKERLPVRTCSRSCPYLLNGGEGCYDFKYGKAALGLPCVPDLRKVEKWRAAYEGGDDAIVKKDGGRIIGSMVVRAEQMLEQIDREGWVRRVPKVDAKGKVITYFDEEGTTTYVMDERPHPLIDPLMKLLGRLGLDPAAFELTPKSKGELGGRTPSGQLVNNGKIDVKILVAEQAQKLEGFKEALAAAAKMREGDPVFRQFSDNKKAIEEE